MNDNLPELRDIHIPESISMWPPAYGWYVMIILIILIYVLYRFYKIWRLKSRKFYALNLILNLEKSNVIAASAQISEILRRVCLYRYPEAVVLEGTKWQEFIVSHCSEMADSNALKLLINAPYLNPEKHPYSQKDLNNLIFYAQSWIGENL